MPATLPIPASVAEPNPFPPPELPVDGLGVGVDAGVVYVGDEADAVVVMVIVTAV